MLSHDEIKLAGLNDVGDWGEKDDRGVYSRPMNIAGELVYEHDLPAFGDPTVEAETKF